MSDLLSILSFERGAGFHPSMLLATGSADHRVYIYNVPAGQQVRQPQCSFFDRRSFLLQDAAELVQKLEGHQDRVYSATFHPTEPLLASCSADFTIRLWASA